MTEYSPELKARMVEKLLRPGGPSATALGRETGIPQSTLSRWVRAAKRRSSATGSSSRARRPEDWSSAEKLEAVLESASLSDQELGSYLRRRGLHRTHLEQWRTQMVRGLESPALGRRHRRKTPEGQRIRALEKEVRRKDAALAETAALLVLQKKAQLLWGDEADTTKPPSGRRSSR